jgi:hypothetical protein
MALGALAVGPAAALGGAFAGFSYLLYRWSYRSALKASEVALNQMLEKIAAGTMSQDVFRAPASGRALS